MEERKVETESRADRADCAGQEEVRKEALSDGMIYDRYRKKSP